MREAAFRRWKWRLEIGGGISQRRSLARANSFLHPRNKMPNAKHWAAVSLAFLLAAACSDSPTAPGAGVGDTGAGRTDLLLEPVVVVGTPRQPGCDPYTDVNFCQGDDGGVCMTGISPALGDFSTVTGCPDTGGSTGTGSSPGAGQQPAPTMPPLPAYEGPGTFVACMGTLLLLMGTTASMEPLAHNLYESRNKYDSARRMYDAVMANQPSLEMELLYEHRVDVAKNGYDDAVRDYALGAGATVLAVGGAALVCSPGMILPTP
jgi:hypothetical protein